MTEAEILDGETTIEELIKILAHSITERAEEGEEDDGGEDNKEIEGCEESEEETKKQTGKKKKDTAETLATIADNCDDALDFIQAVAVKSLRAIAAPISLCADKRARVWSASGLRPTCPCQPILTHKTTWFSRES